MKAFLMYKNKNFDMDKKLPWNAENLIQDLELNTLFDSMAKEDEFLREVVKKGILLSLKTKDEIIYRQDILKDCLKNKEVSREIYRLASDTIENDKKFYYGLFSDYPSTILDRSIRVMEMFVESFENLRKIIDKNKSCFTSEGFKNLFYTLDEELSDEYIENIKEHLKKLKFKNGVLISAELGGGNKGKNYILRNPNSKNSSFFTKIFQKKLGKYSFTIADRDESGFNALNELENRGLNFVANALGQAAENILNFFTMLKVELAFYIGALNLYEELKCIGQPISFPIPLDREERDFSFKNLSDVNLVLSCNKKVVGNDLNGENKKLIMVTGANQGGKSTFLRSIGQAQIMMQSGIFISGESLKANIVEGLFTHYRREEDSSMKSGKLDEELKRMSEIIEHISKNSFVIFNESFASTNERDGSEIAREIIKALLENKIKILFVTHLFELASNCYKDKNKESIFLRAERKESGERTFKIIEGEPLRTSYGEDLYKIIFEKGAV